MSNYGETTVPDKKQVTEWILSGNPENYDLKAAFRELGTLDWKQKANVAVGDIVYIYVSKTVHAIQFKCRARGVDKKLSTIDDSKFQISGEFDDGKGKYMELQMIKEFSSKLLDKGALEKHGFKPSRGPMRVQSEVKEYLDIVQKLLYAEEMEPDMHDATYELVREVIHAYELLEDLSVCDAKDLNLLYLMCVGTWKHGLEAKKKTINESHLPVQEKARLVTLLDTLWERAKDEQYKNNEGKKNTIGMFGTGFYTFQGRTDDNSPRKFIQMCIDIKDMSEDEQIFDRCEQVLNSDFQGMRAASASMVLHCLKPMTFPIFSDNQGAQDIYKYFQLEMKRKTEVGTYIRNARVIKEFRDANFHVKNYRIFDIAARELVKEKTHTEIDYLGVLDYLDNNYELPYKDPMTEGLDIEEKERLLEIKSRGQKAITEMKKMVELCKQKYGLDKCETIQWLDGSNIKTRKYLWAQMKYRKYASNPISVSIFVEVSPHLNKARYRFSLEVKNDGTDKKQMRSYHSYLDLPLQPESSFVYVNDSNERGRVEVINETVDVIKSKLADGTYRKVQLSRIEERTDEITNDELEEAMLEAVGALIPYYEYVVGEEDMQRKPSPSERGNKRIEFDKNIILYGPPGTGKTYYSAIYAVAICDGKTLTELTDYHAVMARYHQLKRAGRVAFTTFHQSYGYEEFIEGIKPVMEGDGLAYKLENGVFKSFCKNARNPEDTQQSHIEQNYVFIIDEINRGNISKIFGELITLIEETKRAGMLEETSAVLPYSGEDFSVPANVYLIGTMNTADRSIALMDTALRRRFQFIEMMPNPQVLRELHADKIEDLDVAAMLEKINERITFLYDREHTIGHAFFTGLQGENAVIGKLRSIFEKSVIPLLQEYFYEDYQKIQLVLGDNDKSSEGLKFIVDKKTVAKDIFRGSVEDVIDLPEKNYVINQEALGNINSYKEIL